MTLPACDPNSRVIKCRRYTCSRKPRAVVVHFRRLPYLSINLPIVHNYTDVHVVSAPGRVLQYRIISHFGEGDIHVYCACVTVAHFA